MDVEDLISGKTKLKFGNAEQMEVIDKYQQAQEEADEGLQLYRVTYHYSGSCSLDVQAHDEFEAREIADEQIDMEEIEWEDLEHTEVELIKEVKHD